MGCGGCRKPRPRPVRKPNNSGNVVKTTGSNQSDKRSRVTGLTYGAK